MKRKKKQRIMSAVAAFGAALTLALLPACGKEKVQPNPNESTVNPQINTGSLASQGKFYADYATFAEEQQAAKRLTVQIAEEGDVLLKNDGALPLNGDEKNITLFGIKSVKLVEAGGGSGAGGLGNNGIKPSTVKSSLEDAGFSVNEKTVALYEKYKTLGYTSEIPISSFTSAVVSSYGGYGDAAVITIGRVGAENIDCATNNVAGHANPDEHYLQLDDNERALVKHVKQYFDKVIVLINSANIMQIPDLAEKKTSDNLGVDAIIWVGTTGNNAIDAVGGILNGSVNPSGHTTDLWSKDFTLDPTFTNFGSNSQNKDADGNRMDAFYYDSNGAITQYAEVQYREDIYAGYRYYETVAYEKNAAGQDGEQWYNSRVLYPFGFGLSYTTFDWTLTDTPEKALVSAPNETVTVKVNVTNTGSVAGKDVVQLYYSAPYTKGGIEKSSVNFAAFAKTKLLAPGESETLTLQFVAQDMASYDFDDINNNGFEGWELEEGEYKITACRDSHTPVLEITRVVDGGFKCETDYTTGAKLDPVFVGDDTTVNESLLANKLSRVDLASAPIPAASTKEDRTLGGADIARLDDQDTYEVWEDNESQPYYKKRVPADWTQAEKHSSGYSDVGLKLADMAGVAKDKSRWTTFMNQLTWNEMCSIVAYGTAAPSLPAIGKSGETAKDGPVQVKGGTLFACAGITAATFNTDLAYKMGRMVGNDCIFLGVQEWLGPGMNIHRSPFSGRNFEYYGEDGVQSGLIAAQVVKGASEKGVLTYIKHCFANDQESFRADYGGVCTWATEQALREIYVRPFEYAIKAGSLGLMSSFNRMGFAVTANSTAVLNTLLRDQFGFTGAIVTDAWTKDFMPLNLMVRAGNDQLLGDGGSYPKNNLTRGVWSAEDNCVKVPANAEEKAANKNTVVSPTHYYAVRTCATNILYTRANSIVNKNCIADGNLSVTVTKGVNLSTAIAASSTSDIEINSRNGSLPSGLSVNGGTVSGKTDAEEGDYRVGVDFTADGWIKVTDGTLNVHVVNAYNLDGNEIVKGRTAATLSLGEAYEGILDSEYFAYGALRDFNNNPGNKNNRKIMTYYEFRNGGGTYNRDEDKSAADIITYPYNPSDIAHELTMTVTSGSLPSGLALQPVRETVAGHNGHSTYDTVTKYKIVGTPTAKGAYTATIKVSVPYATMSGSGIWIYGRGKIDYTITLKLEVA